MDYDEMTREEVARFDLEWTTSDTTYMYVDREPEESNTNDNL